MVQLVHCVGAWVHRCLALLCPWGWATHSHCGATSSGPFQDGLGTEPWPRPGGDPRARRGPGRAGKQGGNCGLLLHRRAQVKPWQGGWMQRKGGNEGEGSPLSLSVPWPLCPAPLHPPHQLAKHLVPQLVCWLSPRPVHHPQLVPHPSVHHSHNSSLSLFLILLFILFPQQPSGCSSAHCTTPNTSLSFLLALHLRAHPSGCSSPLSSSCTPQLMAQLVFAPQHPSGCPSPLCSPHTPDSSRRLS